MDASDREKSEKSSDRKLKANALENFLGELLLSLLDYTERIETDKSIAKRFSLFSPHSDPKINKASRPDFFLPNHKIVLDAKSHVNTVASKDIEKFIKDCCLRQASGILALNFEGKISQHDLKRLKYFKISVIRIDRSSAERVTDSKLELKKALDSHREMEFGICDSVFNSEENSLPPDARTRAGKAYGDFFSQPQPYSSVIFEYDSILEEESKGARTGPKDSSRGSSNLGLSEVQVGSDMERSDAGKEEKVPQREIAAVPEKRKVGRPRKVQRETESSHGEEEELKENKKKGIGEGAEMVEKKKRGRPKKECSTVDPVVVGKGQTVGTFEKEEKGTVEEEVTVGQAVADHGDRAVTESTIKRKRGRPKKEVAA